uniref:Kelch domain-containing protein 1 isoform X2 n=1 Tax=Pogona vitticeps TaxID=103695 RepID=A0ABM5FC92_9SAUR
MCGEVTCQLKRMKFTCLMMSFGSMRWRVDCGRCTSWKGTCLHQCLEVAGLALMGRYTSLEDLTTKDTAIGLIYFGGYGCRKQSELSECFDVHDAFWEGQIFWGWHNDVHVFDTTTRTWYQPTIKHGLPPQPRAAHSCAVLGNRGYVFGGRVLQTRMNDLHSLNLDTWAWSGKICTNGEKPRDRSWHTLTPITDDRLFLFGGLSSDNVPLSDGWIYVVTTNKWEQLAYLPKNIPRLWHTACLGKEGEVMIFGGSKDDLHFMDTGHCSDLLIFQTQPYSLLRLTLDCIGKNSVLLRDQISWLPSRLRENTVTKITFWSAVNHRQERKAKAEEQERVRVS